jgi:hypothetical protein
MSLLQAEVKYNSRSERYYRVSLNIRPPHIFTIKNKIFFTEFYMSYSFEGCKQKGVKTLLLSNKNPKLNALNIILLIMD